MFLLETKPDPDCLPARLPNQKLMTKNKNERSCFAVLCGIRNHAGNGLGHFHS